MLYGKVMLRLFETLGRAQPLSELRPGMRVARGFADVGYEEFLILPNENILSLLTGAITPLDGTRREHLFPVLSADDLVRTVRGAGYEVGALEQLDGRNWRVVARKGGADEVCGEGGTLEECLLRAALAVNNATVIAEGRCLKTAMANG